MLFAVCLFNPNNCAELSEEVSEPCEYRYVCMTHAQHLTAHPGRKFLPGGLAYDQGRMV